jgi:hypothetical protein
VNGPLLAALNRDPEKRFGSCKKFAAVLEAAFLSVDAISEPKRRGWPLLAYLALAGAAVVAALVVMLFWPHKGGTPTRPDVIAAANIAPKPGERETGETRVPAAGKTRRASSSSLDSGKPASGASSKPGEAPIGDKPKPFSASGQTSQALVAPAPAPPARPARPVDASTFVDPAAARGFMIEVYSRKRPVKDGDSFAFSDPVRGELAHGDLLAIVTFGGLQPPRGRLTLEWAVGGVSMDWKAVPLNQLVEYGNEPTAGDYVLTLHQDGRPVQTFKFSIRP